MKIKLPPKVMMIIDTLQAKGYEAYAVGGCVRDSILGREPDDWDITTSAMPEEVKGLFPRTIDTGIEHGTVTVMVDHQGFEVTTYRIDGKYEDARHPSEVTFTRNLTEDLKRRDFTINAMAYNAKDGLVDLFCGMDDLQKKQIRCVGDPMERFNEDALRILRAVRFSAQLGFSIEHGTIEAVRNLAPALSKISAERICTELTKLLLSEHPEYIKIAYEIGITGIILPEFDAMMETPQISPYHCYNVGEHTLVALKSIPADKVLRYTMLLHDTGKPAARKRDRYGVDHFRGHSEISERLCSKILRRLKMDNETIRRVKHLVKYHDWFIKPIEKEVRRAAFVVGTEPFSDLMKVQYADSLARDPSWIEQGIKRVEGVWELYKKIVGEGQCVSIKQLALNGNDLIKLGIPEGKQIGEALNAMMEAVLEDPERNNPTFLSDFVDRNRKSFLQPSK